MQICCFPLSCIQTVQMAGKTERAARYMSAQRRTEKPCILPVRKKGIEGVKDTVTEDYQGILVHDHDRTFYNYGTDHQECLAHVLRYLKGSMDNEPDRTWNKDMHSLVQEMIHFRNGLQPSEELDPCKVSEFEERYRKILETARKEYENVPANDYYRDGYNLFLRIEKYMQNHLLFLHDLRVPATNNEAERLLRNYKRKQAQAVTFRSFESIDYLCQCMSMLVLMRLEEPENIFDTSVQDIWIKKTDGFNCFSVYTIGFLKSS